MSPSSPTPGPATRRFVDWVDYADTIQQTPVLPFAQMLLDRAGPDHNVWLVWSIGYKSFGKRCEQLLHALGGYRHWADRVRISRHSPEHLGLIRFDSGAGPGCTPPAARPARLLTRGRVAPNGRPEVSAASRCRTSCWIAPR